MSGIAALLGITGLAGSGIAAIGANSAANTQANSADKAAQLQLQESNNALDFTKSQYNNSLQMLNPYLQTGYGALGMLRNGLGIGGPMPQGFNLPSQNTNQGSGADPGNLGPAFDNNPFINRLHGGSPASGPQLIQANGAAVPSSGGGSAFVSNGPAAANGGGNAFVGGPQASGNPGGPQASGTPGGAIQANGSGSAMVPNADPSAGGSGPGFGSLLQGYGPFQAPDSVTEQNDPGYMFRLNTGLDQMTNSAAARGGLLSGGTAKAMQDFAQQDASNEYGNVYNRAQSTYGTNYNTFTNNQTNQFNKLAAISGLGQTTANQLSTAGLNTAGQVGSNLLGTGAEVGQDLQNAGAARASGIVGATNAATGGLGQLALLSQILGGSGGGGTGFPGGIGDPNVGGFCWIAEELYGVDSPKTHAIRAWLKNEYSKTPIGKKFTDWYLANGERVAEKIKSDQPLRDKFQRLFDMFASHAVPEPLEDYESVRYQR